MRTIIGVDLGGTQLRVIRCDTSGNILAREAVGTANQGPSTVVDQIVQLIRPMLATTADDVLGIGVGTPGPVEGHSGVVFEAPNLHGWTNVPLKAMLQERLGLPVEVGNDANAAAVGEWMFGSGHGTDDFVYVTVSTGIGGGVIANRQLLLGRKGMAGEVGHMIIEPNGPICGCGNRGCWEAIASGTALGRRAGEEMQRSFSTKLHDLATPSTVTAIEVSQAAQQGDSLASTLLNEEGTLIGIGLVNVLHLYSPERIALGGGVMKSWEFIREPIARTIATRAMGPYRDVPIEVATLGANVGLLGAAALVLAAHGQAPIDTQ